MWANGLTGAGQTIAVLDTGTHTSHPFLAGKVVEEACYSINSNCPNGAITMTGAGSGVYCTYAPDGCQHGTHVAGIAAGQGSNFSGVGKGASIMSVQVFSRCTGAANCGAGEDPCTLSNFSDQVTFRCSLDGGPFTSCSPPKVYRTLSRGGHTLRVYAVGAAGETEDRDTTPAVFRWRVVRG
jgi:subtilisin family serine protease